MKTITNMKNYYEVLHVTRNANNNEIKKAYRAAALFWHPDKNKSPNAHNTFIDIVEAYNILIDIEKRKIYDALLNEEEHYQNTLDNIKINNPKVKEYTEWVYAERMRGEKLATISSDQILTDSFYFVDNYGIIIIILIVIGVLIWGLSLQ